MALACGMASPALAQVPQPFVAPQNPAPIPTNAAAGQATVTFRPVAGPVAGPIQSGSQAVVPATAAMPPQQPVAQHAHYQSVPGQSQHQVRQTALVQQYDEFVKQLPPSPSSYPLERSAQVIPTGLQGDPAPAPTDVAPMPEGDGAPTPTEPPARMMESDAHGHTHTHGASCNQCGQGSKNCGCQRGPSGIFWVRADYLLWWTKGSPLPPLVTSSPDTTPLAQAGVLGQPGTTILFGDNDVNNEDRSGYRFRAGYWFDCCMCSGIEAEYFQLDTKTDSYDAFCPPGGTLNRPFFNVQTGLQDSELVCYPGVVNGSVHVNADSDFQSGGIRFVKNYCQREWCLPAGDCCDKMIRGGYRLDWLAGYRYMRLDEGVMINEMLVSTNTGGVIPLGTTFDVQDNFQTDSEFHGADFGMMAQWRRGRWTLDVLGKTAVGNVHNSVSINGSTTTMVPNGPTTTNPGGLLAQGTNIGTYESDDFSIVPEASLNIGYNVTPRLRALVGYTFIYWSNVVRPGDQIDLGLNPSQFPPGTLVGAARPAFTMNDSDFWAQGFNVGAEYRF
jgi:hypothetical protein